MKHSKTLLSFLLVIFLAACANQELTNSGHILNADKLTAIPTSKIEKHKKIEEFVVADAQQRSFNHIAIAPIKFRLDADATEELEPEDQKKLAEYFDKTIREQLEGFPVLEDSNTVPPGTYYVDAVVTDINGSSAWLNILLTATVALPFDTGGITVEVSISDVDTREEVAAFRGYREGTMFHVVGGATEYGHAKGGIDLYAEQIKTLLTNFQCTNCDLEVVQSN